eukprot:UN24119
MVQDKSDLNEIALRQLTSLRALPMGKIKETQTNKVELIFRALHGKLQVPDFRKFCSELDKMYHECKYNVRGGNVDTANKMLAEQDPRLWSIAVCTIDGQEYSKGHANYKFSVQSCCAPVVYLMTATERGDEMHNYIGREPSGKGISELSLKEVPTAEYPNRQIPHNPMLSA